MTKSFSQKIVADKNFYLKLVSSTNPQGEDFYAYVLIDGKDEEKFEQALKTKSVNLEDWGKIIYSGEGKTPSDEIAALVKAIFDAMANAE